MAGAGARRGMRREAIRRLAAAGAGLAVLWAGQLDAAAEATITTVAGGGSAAGDGVPALAASLSSPIGLAPTANGFLVAEQGRHRIRRLTADGTDSGLIGTLAGTGAFGGGTPVLGGSAASVPLQLPCCLSQAPSGALLVADTFAGMVHRISGSRLDTVAGTGAPSSCSPVPPHEVAALAAQLCFVVGVGGHPSDGRFLIAEDGLPDQDRSGGARVYEVDAAGTLRIVAGGGCPSPPADPGPLQLCLENPRGVVFTGPGTQFLVADRARHVVWRVSSTNPVGATATRVAGGGAASADLGDGGPAAAARLAAPSDLAMTPSGHYLIADRDHCRIRRVAGLEPVSPITTVAGSSCRPGAEPADGGSALAADLRRPLGVAFAPGGILISDTGRGTVRLVDRTSLTGAPGPVSASRRARLSFRSTEPVPEFLCSVDGAPAHACSSPLVLDGLGDGAHTFSVRDAAVPGDPTPARRAWLVDTQPPRSFRRLAPADGATGSPARPAFEWEAAQDETSGIERYELWVDSARLHEVTPASCTEGVCRVTPATPLAETAHEWEARAVDAAGHVRTTDPGAFDVGSPPVARLAVAPNPVLAGSEAVLDAGDSSDAEGPLARHEWDLDGDGRFEHDTGAQGLTTTGWPLPGRFHVAVRVTDGAGRSSVERVEVRVTEPPEGPRAFGVTIDSGAAFTRSPAVTVTAFHGRSTDAVLVSNDGGFLAAGEFAPGTPIRWRLASSGPERLPKTVWVRFRSGPFLSEAYTDDIVLDESAPRVAAARVSASRPGPLLHVSAADRGSGVDRMQVTTDRTRPGRAVAFRRRFALRTAAAPTWVRVLDRAGNRSRWRAARYSGPR